MTCPQPVLKARALLRDMPSGQVLEIQGDDPTLGDNLTAFATRSGDRLLGREEREGCLAFFLRRA
jgi:TusA-related sulfurtransferase